MSVKMKVGLGDMVWVRHVVIHGCAGEPVRALAVFKRIANGCINRDLGDVDTLGPELPRHALGETILGMARHGATRSSIFSPDVKYSIIMLNI